MADDIEVEIFGQTFRVATGDATPAYIRRLAAYVDQRMRTITESAKTVPMHRMAVLTALNIADDFLKLQDQYEHLTHMLHTKTEQLIALVQEQVGDVSR
jgi:cell division protein ZapA